MPKLTKSVEVKFTVDDLANLFTDLSAEEQATFFYKMTANMNQWLPGRIDTQCAGIGRHLRAYGMRHAVATLRVILESATQE